ncbi:MAG: hypothetical protein N3D20_00475, partial [Candidatus Pacearchaeota archaeon]|nr:hypothetical protein [Candidatus Pacearchaeota archaeon]
MIIKKINCRINCKLLNYIILVSFFLMFSIFAISFAISYNESDNSLILENFSFFDNKMEENDNSIFSVLSNKEDNLISIQASLNSSGIFFEDFESGSFTTNGWNLSCASGSSNWTIATTNPYQGTYYAEAMPQSTTEPASVIEIVVSTQGYQNITFSYYRRLIGIDPADEFKAKWYDGSTWYILEETASNSANDANYVFKNFSLQSSA